MFQRSCSLCLTPSYASGAQRMHRGRVRSLVLDFQLYPYFYDREGHPAALSWVNSSVKWGYSYIYFSC